METFKEKVKQINILEFLIELGKSEDKCYMLLKKVFKNRCITRNSIHAYFDEVNGNARQSSNKKKEIEKKMDKVLQ